MRIANVDYGVDTGMCLVDVVLETAEERAMNQASIWRALAPHFAAKGIDPRDVVDLFTYSVTENGDLKRWPSC